MDTKLYLNFNGPKLYPKSVEQKAVGEQYTHKPEDVRIGLMDSLEALKCGKVDMFYLRGLDRKTPLDDTLHEVNELHRAGYFNDFGISNYIS